MKQKRKESMYVSYRENVPHLKPSQTSKLMVECYKCDYWCEYEYDLNWRQYFYQTPKNPFWFIGSSGITARVIPTWT